MIQAHQLTIEEQKDLEYKSKHFSTLKRPKKLSRAQLACQIAILEQIIDLLDYNYQMVLNSLPQNTILPLLLLPNDLKPTF